MKRAYKILGNKVAESDDSDSNILVYISPDPEEKKFLIDTLKLDEHTLNSALDPDEISRLEFEPDHIAIIMKRPKNYSSKFLLSFKVTSMGLFIFSDRIIIILPEDIPVFEGKSFDKSITLKDITLKLVQKPVVHFLEHLKTFSIILDELESKINRTMQNKYLLNLFTLEKSLVYYLSAINSNMLVIEKMKSNASKFVFNTDEQEFLDDIKIENSQCYKQAEIYSSILSSMMEARSSIVSNNINTLMKTLNIITIGIMLPSLVVGIFSMNVDFPLRGHPWAFWFILLFAALSVATVIYFWKKLKW
ncbi:MAG: magnesium transporter CorA family protein [Candidatus Kapaibacterium sp.]